MADRDRNEWTRVEIRPPEPEQVVLGWDVLHSTYRFVTWDGQDTDGDGWPRLVPRGGGNNFFVKYWRRLPLPPREERNG